MIIANLVISLVVLGMQFAILASSWRTWMLIGTYHHNLRNLHQRIALLEEMAR